MIKNLKKETLVFRAVNEALDGKGFNASKSHDIFWKEGDGFKCVISLHASRHSKEEFDVRFGVWSDELMNKAVRYTDNDDEWAHYPSSAYHTHPLSPDDPLISEYKWGEADKVSELEILKRQVLNLALPYFDTFKNYADFFEMVVLSSDAKKEEIKKVKAVSEKYTNKRTFDDQNVERITQEAFTFLLKHQFHAAHQGNLFWRKRGDIFDYVSLQYPANHRFLMVYAGVWHPALMLGERSSAEPVRWFLEDIPIPTVAMTKLVTNSEINGDLNLVFLGHNLQHTTQALQSQVNASKEYVLEWFEPITTLDKVLHAMPPIWQLRFKSKLMDK